MIEVWFVDGDKERFEIKHDEYSHVWVPEEKAYLIQCIDCVVVIPSSFVKLIKYIEVD